MDKERRKNYPHNPHPRATILYFDGSCEPNNPGGTIGYGAVIKKNGQVIHTLSGRIEASRQNSNNVAEYLALTKGLEWLLDNDHKNDRIEVYGDSALVINQMNKDWGASGGLYYEYYRDALDMLPHFPDIKFRWIPREINTEADALSTSHLTDIPKTDWSDPDRNKWKQNKNIDWRYT